MKAGFGKCEITPRVGVELCGFGPYLNRTSIGVRDHLWARAVAFEQHGVRVVVASCDLIGISAGIVAAVRDIVCCQAGIAPEAVMLHGTHTHSGPSTGAYIGWGEPDPPYLALLPRRIAAACIAALDRLRDASLRHAEAPCEGIGLNREYDRDGPPLAEVLREDWRPARPDLTDTTCHVLRVDAADTVMGFLAYFGCHPVVCCQQTRHIHGDYCGVAMNLLEREHAGATAMFLQGAQRDVNSCCVHKPEEESLQALDIVAARFASAVRRGLRETVPVDVDRIAFASREVPFSRKPWDRARLEALLAGERRILNAPDASDESRDFRLAKVRETALLRLMDRLDRGERLQDHVPLQGFRIGPVALLAAPFEIFHAIKEDVRVEARAPVPLVMGITNGVFGYAPDRTAAQRGGYAADLAPLICGIVPFASSLHDELVQALLALDQDLDGRDAISCTLCLPGGGAIL